MKRSLGIALALVLPALSACANGRINTNWPFPVEPAAAMSTDTPNRNRPLRQMQVNLITLLSEELRHDGMTIMNGAEPANPTAGTVYLGRNSGQLATAQDVALERLMAAVPKANHPRQIRNDVVSAFVGASTANCTVYVQALRSGQVSTRMASDFFAGGFAAASSLAAPPASAKLLSALSAFSTAEGSSVDRNIFAQQGAELVADAILQLRATDRAGIEAKMSSEYDAWPLGLALADLFAYQGDCSMLRGFSKMRDALVAREQAISAIRTAAGAVEKSGGSSAQIVAVLEGLPSAQALAGPTAPTAAEDWSPDLGKLRDTAKACLNDLVDALANDKTETVETLRKKDEFTSGKCALPPSNTVWSLTTTDWPLTYLTIASQTLDQRAAALDKSQTAATSDDRSSQLAPDREILIKAYTDAAAKAFDPNVGARTVAMDMAAKWPAGRPADDVVNSLKSIGGAYATKDPVFVLAIAAADEAKISHAPDQGLLGVLAASQAHAAAGAYVQKAGQ
ncbi:MAG TPA: hypothetical protein VG960_12185 [Caulobacteraceae bacterium]|nr:hypothetical protein [Caulobacteraceae bacterium]